jgi:hypothetical protein
MTGIDGCQFSAFVFENKWIGFSGWVRVNGFETLRDRGQWVLLWAHGGHPTAFFSCPGRLADCPSHMTAAPQ